MLKSTKLLRQIILEEAINNYRGLLLSQHITGAEATITHLKIKECEAMTVELELE